MPAKVLVVKLTASARALLQETVSTGVAPAGTLLPARILRKADAGEEGPGWPDARICEALEVSRATVERVRQQYGVAGLDVALARRHPPPPAATRRHGRGKWTGPARPT
jgi:hypothetical protein